ncbi:MAG: type II toxin-antitoxin system RelE/ParE family toxin [Burkholderiaceae bacterium]
MSSVKELRFIGSSLDDLARFPAEAKRAAGFELWQVQNGLDPSDWKPMNSVGIGVREIRLHVGGAWRVLYVAKFAEAVYVLHAFRKKTQRTARSDLELGARRYAQIAQK